jgi:non-lysosomal glucosylceramidase
MGSLPGIPEVAWQRRLDNVLEDPGGPGGATLDTVLGALAINRRLNRYLRQERHKGRETYLNPASPLDPGPVMGVPLGGIGGGSVGRGWRGDFVRWGLQAGIVEYRPVRADQFSLYVRRPGQRGRSLVLNPDRPEGGALHGWGWNLSGKASTYHALFPRAWTVYREPDPQLKLTCRQVSPVIPHEYRASSTPAGVFAWTVENSGAEPVTVGVMFTFQNGTGGDDDRIGGHLNRLFRAPAEGGEVIGVALHHTHRQPRWPEEGQEPDEDSFYEDPLTFAIAAQAAPGVEVTYRTRFVSSSSGMDVWGDFREDGALENVEDERPSGPGLAVGAALCATVEVPPGETREFAFALAWDMPLARFGSGAGYYRRCTRFFGRDGDQAPAIACRALADYPSWEQQIEAWQKPILDDPDLPDWYKAALFNELYYLVEGGTIWTDGKEGEEPPPEGEVGHFACLESHEDRLYNSYDAHFYASYALAMLWPELERSLQRDFARALFESDEETRKLIGSGKSAARKLPGAIPHDLGTPVEAPWEKVNAYNFLDASLRKDLNSMFVLQVYRDVLAADDQGFLAEMQEVVGAAMDYLLDFDLDEDGLIENEGLPDHTFDMWLVDGPSAYSGGLWLAALSASAAMADLVGASEEAARYRELLDRGRQSYEELLWTGEYYAYDSSSNRQSNTILAAQAAGMWYAGACGLPSIVPDEHLGSALAKIFEFNVKQFEEGQMGAVNGMRPDGRVDTSSIQSQEVWPGITYALAAAMLQAGLREEAFAAAEGVCRMTYDELGYWFQTPEAWTIDGDHRMLASMRPLAIWAMQWAWERGRNGEGR